MSIRYNNINIELRHYLKIPCVQRKDSLKLSCNLCRCLFVFACNCIKNRMSRQHWLLWQCPAHTFNLILTHSPPIDLGLSKPKIYALVHGTA